MTNIEAKISRLLISNPEQSRSITGVFIPEITPLEIQNFGHLFVLTEIDVRNDANGKVLQLVETELKKNYYGSDKLNVELAFEDALQKTNSKLHELIASGEKDWVEVFNCIVGVHKGDELHIAQLGSMHAFFIQKNKIVNIIDQAGDNSGKINPLKIFSNVISGSVKENDSLLFCNNSLLDYISQEKIRRIITENSPENAVATIQNLLNDSTNGVSFIAIILGIKTPEITVNEEMRAPIIAQNDTVLTAPETSMNGLVNQERSTTELLTPSIWPNISKKVKNLGEKLKGRVSKKGLDEKFGEDAGVIREIRNRDTEKQSILSTSFKYIKLVGKKVFELFILSMRGIRGLFKKKESIRGHIRTLPHKTSKETARFLVRIKRMSNPRKAVLGIAVLLIVIFAFNIVNMGKREDRKLMRENYAKALVQAEEKTSEAEAALIYENEEDSRVLLSDAKNLIQSIPDEEEDLQGSKNELLKKIQDQLDKVNHIVKITSPEIVADLASAGEGFSPAGIILLGGNLYSFDSAENTILNTVLEDKSVAVESAGTLEGSLTTGIPLTNNLLLLKTDSDIFYEYNIADAAFTSRKVESANVDNRIGNYNTYLGRIYTLDTKNNQIFRHEKSGNDWGLGSAWITDVNLDVTNANSIAVDGAVYVAKNNGEVWKLFSGAKDEEFKTSTIDPAFSNPTKIYTTPDLENVYVIDPNNKRIVILDKNGGLVNQYFSDSFDNLKDFAVSESDNVIYLLNGNSIYKIDL
ncbi:MAG: hypothetical protein WCW66_06595 [Patescibacteria group bacterium]